MVISKKYNYNHFSAEHYDFTQFESLLIGSSVPDVTVMSLEGEPISLRSISGRIVVETGCITCPMFMACVEKMNELAKIFKDTTFLVLYTREAHPGEHIPAHSSLAAKMHNARRLEKILVHERKILVDGIDGNLHKQLGALPHSAFVFTVQGVLKYRANWCDPDQIKTLLSGLTISCEEAPAGGLLAPKIPSLYKSIPLIIESGRSAAWAVIRSLPKLASARKAFKQRIKKSNPDPISLV
jgi:hypothetical protein